MYGIVTPLAVDGTTKPESSDCHARTAPRLFAPGANHPGIDAERASSPPPPMSTNCGMSVVMAMMLFKSARETTSAQLGVMCRSL